MLALFTLEHKPRFSSEKVCLILVDLLKLDKKEEEETGEEESDEEDSIDESDVKDGSGIFEDLKMVICVRTDLKMGKGICFFGRMLKIFKDLYLLSKYLSIRLTHSTRK